MKDSDFREWVEELKSRCDIVTVISRYCNVVKRGRYHWTCCPFHVEKLPSMCIYDTEQCYHCYGCKEHGDVIKFVRKMESCDYMQAIEILARSVGMEVPNFSITNDDGIQKRKKEKDDILRVLKDANNYYKRNLYSSVAKPAQDYIKKRKLTKKELDNFGLGYSIGFREVIFYLKSRGYSEEIMEKAGLIDKNQIGYYDIFGERLTFPLFNIYDECIGFSARILTDDKTKAKYKNSPNTIVFDKSNVIYGINLVRKFKQNNKIDNVIIVEGQMDVIAMHRAGFCNTVACLGTAFTEKHARLLKLISDKVVLCLDGDSAGKKATNKIINILVDNNFSVKCARIPDNHDPDEYIDIYGREKMQELIDNAVNYLDFQIDYLAEGFDLTKNDEKAKFVKGSLQLLQKLKTNSERQVYLPHIKLLSGVPIDVLQNDLFEGVVVSKTEKQPSIQSMEDGFNKAIKFLLASILYKKEYVTNYNIRRFLHNEIYIKLYDLILERKAKNQELRVGELYDIFDVDNEPNLVDIINYNFEENGNNEKYYDECIWSLVEKELKTKQAKLNNMFSESKDMAERKQILLEIDKVTKKLKNRDLEE